ncbi:3-oxoacyl-ACP synthase [Amycolatopsis sp. OK19-0408]|uniref:3-oxoacyl-ACP synthase n=1 Tax=Amycolatopsis iheyensis TaxID=2945988 RepID=A0A9X2NNN6_9PSEU|nr:3-oxoacyl-[acyl-carrier-protein] synthase III C-terminal domain-containing protein [Amycolatopsis iheyensis]MCR6488430.1 3-oxoacyl-ACP synthase [Amycolatopsis iheyensis]
MTIGIGAIACLLPGDLVEVAELPETRRLGAREREFVAHSGVRTVGVFDGKTPVDLAAQACRDLLADDPRVPDQLIAIGSRAPEVLIGSDACHIQFESGLRDTFPFTLDGLGCAGSAAAWSLARDLLVADPARDSVMITYASRPTGVDRIRFPVTVIGDGAFAMTLVRDGRPVLRAHRMAADGRFHGLFRVDYKDTPLARWREECRDLDQYRFDLAMQSRTRLGHLVEEVLAEAGATKADVATTLLPNVTASAYTFYERSLGLRVHPVCGEHLARFGHLGAMDVVLNLDRVRASGGLRPGDLVLVLSNSPVAAWTATLWEF